MLSNSYFRIWVKSRLKNALDKLVEAGYIIAGDFNENKFKRPTWYALGNRNTDDVPKGDNDVPKGNNDDTEREQRECQKGTSNIYNNNKENLNTNDYTNENTNKGKRKKPKRSDLPLKVYGEQENVLLTEEEYNRLVNDNGEVLTVSAINYLSNYMVERSYDTDNHNLTLRRWVFDAVKKRNAQQQYNKPEERVTERFEFDDEGWQV